MGFRVWGSELRVSIQDVGLKVWGSELRVQDSGLDSEFKFRVQDSGCRAQVSGFTAMSPGFKGVGLRFPGSRPWVQGSRV